MKTGRTKSSDSGEEKPVKKKAKIEAPPAFKLNYTPNFTPQPVSDIVTPPPPKALVGKPFSDAINALRDGGEESVHTKFNLNVKVGKRAPEKVSLQADYSVSNQGTGLTQAMMTTPNYSAYVGKQEKSSVLPQKLSLQRGVLESRAIKQLSDSGDGYKADAKVTPFDELEMVGRKKDQFPKETVMGGIAFGSFLEDITAVRAVGLKNVGSAMRAKTMAHTWNMKTNEKAEVDGFQSEMLSAFPQLGKKALQIGDLEESGISAMNEHWKTGGDDFTKDMQVGNIVDAHKQAYGSAAKRFEHKLGKFYKSEAVGKWWSGKADALNKFGEDVHSEAADVRKNAEIGFQDLGKEYVQRKMTRHGIKFED